MVLLHELEFDDIANVGSDGFWSVSEDGSHAGCDGRQSTDDNLSVLDGSRQLLYRKLTVCVAGPLAAAGARLMTCICAAASPATTGSALMYFIMTILRKVVNAKGT